MSGIYIPGMEMPTKGDYHMTLYVCGDGAAYVDVAELPADEDRFAAVPVPQHGRLIDESAIDLSKYEKAAHDALHNGKGSILYDSGVLAGARAITQLIRRAPTIIPADKEAGVAIINHFPAADVPNREVGTWIPCLLINGKKTYVCNKCVHGFRVAETGEYVDMRGAEFCPHCGAKMEES